MTKSFFPPFFFMSMLTSTNFSAIALIAPFLSDSTTILQLVHSNKERISSTIVLNKKMYHYELKKGKQIMNFKRIP